MGSRLRRGVIARLRPRRCKRAIIVLTPILRWGISGQPDTLLSPLQMRLPERKGGALLASQATRLKSGVMIMRIIYISALKCGDSEEHTS